MQCTRSRARKSPSPSHPHPKCFTHVSVGAIRSLSITIDSEFLASQNFDFDISHWANSSSQVPVCTVEPGTPTDVGIIVNRSFCQGTLTILDDVCYVNHYSLSKSTKLAYHLQLRAADIPPTLAFRRPKAYIYPWPSSGKLLFMKTRGQSTLEQGLPGLMSMNILSPSAWMLPEVTRMALVSLVLPLVEVGPISTNSYSIVRTERVIYDRIFLENKPVRAHCRHCYGFRAGTTIWWRKDGDRAGWRSLVRPQGVSSLSWPELNNDLMYVPYYREDLTTTWVHRPHYPCDPINRHPTLKGNRDKIHPEIASTNRCLGLSYVLIWRSYPDWMRQGAILGFAGGLAEPAQAAFASFLAQQHDHKAAQTGIFVYSNGSVRPTIS